MNANAVLIPTSGGPSDSIGRVFLETAGAEVTEDLRPWSLDQTEWDLVVQAADEPVLLTWDAESVPTGMFLSLLNVDTAGAVTRSALISMAEETTLAVPAGQESRFRIRYAGDVTACFRIQHGWNLVSIPVDPGSLSSEQFLSELSADRGGKGGERKTTSRIWEAYAQQFRPADTVQALRSYWIYCVTPQTVAIRGQPVVQTQLAFRSGWNAASVSAGRAVPVDDAVRGLWWRWDPASGRYVPVIDHLQPGVGYLVNCRAAHELLLGSE